MCAWVGGFGVFSPSILLRRAARQGGARQAGAAGDASWAAEDAREIGIPAQRLRARGALQRGLAEGRSARCC